MTTDTAPRVDGASQADGTGTWAVLLPAGRYDAERLVHHDTLELTGLADVAALPRVGDQVAVLADEPLRLVAVGRVAAPTSWLPEDPDDPQSDRGPQALVVTYTRRAFDEPVPADTLALGGPVTALDAGAFRDLVERLGPPPQRQSWLVSLDLPIEADSPAEAVRLFWAYVQELGPQELPAFVSPSGDELSMQAFVLGAEANQDPEEDD
ncbi:MULTISPECIES: hypothetical protein [Micromonospora]|uniref:DUF4265 domain-containing protein n=1 Tax=Micromonospora maris TaxID=1003110 RepID=A0A9X0I785_9ACTN|nr:MULTISPECIES: hypothetical protein [Micromonospora]AEB42732.1 hypothetical protein VAB18032_08070 [Micromonospora maris AB-18-032]KUJ48157.1 hypothetical protein ADL17_03525 [Micromonospora maris]RUL92550.1 hypothetical protein EG812_14070 [Verrucosispora sp. FIM060022]WSK43784.1 hypothetical protein OG712_06475 [Micromonospora maris]